MHSFVLARRGHDGAKAAFADEEGIDLDDLVIVNEVFRRVDPVDADSPAAHAPRSAPRGGAPAPAPPGSAGSATKRIGAAALGAGAGVGAALAARRPGTRPARTATGAVRAGAERRGAARETATEEALRVTAMFASARAVVPEAAEARRDARRSFVPAGRQPIRACVSRISRSLKKRKNKTRTRSRPPCERFQRGAHRAPVLSWICSHIE